MKWSHSFVVVFVVCLDQCHSQTEILWTLMVETKTYRFKQIKLPSGILTRHWNTTSLIGNTFSKGPSSIAMLNYQSVIGIESCSSSSSIFSWIFRVPTMFKNRNIQRKLLNFQFLTFFLKNPFAPKLWVSPNLGALKPFHCPYVNCISNWFCHLWTPWLTHFVSQRISQMGFHPTKTKHPSWNMFRWNPTVSRF